MYGHNKFNSNITTSTGRSAIKHMLLLCLLALPLVGDRLLQEDHHTCRATPGRHCRLPARGRYEQINRVDRHEYKYLPFCATLQTKRACESWAKDNQPPPHHAHPNKWKQKINQRLPNPLSLFLSLHPTPFQST